MSESTVKLVSINKDANQGHYIARVLHKKKYVAYKVVVDESGLIPVTTAENNLFADFNTDIQCYSNILKAVHLTHKHHALKFPLNLHEDIDTE